MTRKEKQQKLVGLQEKAAFGELTAKEEMEMIKLAAYIENTDGPRATQEQRDYIEDLLFELGEDLEGYTDIALEDLTVEDASLIIDELKEEVELFEG